MEFSEKSTAYGAVETGFENQTEVVKGLNLSSANLLNVFSESKGVTKSGLL